MEEASQVEEPLHEKTEAASDPPPGAAKAEAAAPPRASPFSLAIWPPSQRTRDAVARRLVETLSSPSVLSKRYGTVSVDEATAAAAGIEAEAFAAASSSAPSGDSASVDDGIETLQIYSKEISKRMLEFVKARSGNAAPEESGLTTVEVSPSPELPPVAAAAAGEEVSSLESETSAA